MYAPLQMTEIKAYLEMIGADYCRAEIEVLLMLDRIYLSIMNEAKNGD